MCNLCYAATLNYRDEVRIKNDALQTFWLKRFPHVPLHPLVPSPRGRAYRTTTKRKVFQTRTGISLGLIDPSESSFSGSFTVLRCAIEPDEHAEIYSTLQVSLRKSYAGPLAEHLRYVIIRGSYDEFTVLFNVRETTPELRKAANTLSKALTRASSNVVGLFLYEATGRDRYYMESPDHQPGRSLTRIFGQKDLYQKIAGRPFLYSPASFSQVNPSVAELMISTAAHPLLQEGNGTLVDLYCGYGLFSLSLARHVREVVGVEVSPESVQSAIANAKRQRVSNVRFIRSDINASTIVRIMKGFTRHDSVLLDPPRGGTSNGVIEAVAAKEPQRVVHIFCNVEIMEREISRWTSSGYKFTEGHAFDMFPGTPTAEIVAYLKR